MKYKYPATVYLVGGTQADKPKNNELMIMKISQLHKTRNSNEIFYWSPSFTFINNNNDNN